MATHSSTLAWKIPWMEEPGRLQSMGWLRVRHDWASSLSVFTFMHWRRKWQPTAVFLPGESQGRGSPVGCRLWGRTESDTTEATSQQQQQRSWEGLILKLKLQYFHHLMWRADSLETTLVLGKIEGRRRRGRQRMRWLDGISDSADMSLSKLWAMVKDREAWCAQSMGSKNSQTWLSDWTASGPWKYFATWNHRLPLSPDQLENGFSLFSGTSILPPLGPTFSSSGCRKPPTCYLKGGGCS